MVSVVRWPCHLFYLARIFVFASPTLPPCHGNKWYMGSPFCFFSGLQLTMMNMEQASGMVANVEYVFFHVVSLIYEP